MKLRKKAIVLLFLVGLPIHTFLMMVLFGSLGIPSSIIGILSAWKETLVVGISLLIVCSLLWKKPIRLKRFTPTDGLILLFAVWVGVRLIGSYTVGSYLPLGATLYGLRFYLLPISLYTIGRLSPLNENNLRSLLWGITLIGALTGGLALVEWLLPNTLFINILESLGYQNYFRDYVNQTTLYGEGYTSASMWLSLSGDQFIRRAGSIYMVSKPFAFTYLLIIPVMLAFLWVRPVSKSPNQVRFFLTLAWVGLIFSFTRAAIVVCLLITMCMAFNLGRSKLALRISIVLLIGGLVGLALPPVQGYLGRILQAEDSSTRQHLDGWINGLSTTADQFILGFGVGTANQELSRFDLGNNPNFAGSVSESLYVQTFQELGIIGLLLYLSILLSVLFRSSKMAKAQDYEQRFFGISLFWITVACLLISVVAILSQGSFLVTYFFWFLCGQANGKALTRSAQIKNRLPQYAYSN